MTAPRDLAFMDRALFWAERGRGRTSPNPIVGAVVVSSDGVVVGQGAHLEAGGPHAEVIALEAAGARAANGTLYCTLEPCSHTGRTGPCVERIAAAGIRRVVAATADANPVVAGRGFAFLRARGLDVVEGTGRAAADRQLAPFFRWVRDRRPFVTVKVVVSRDGYVGRAGERTRLTGPVADRYFHRQRAEIDAIAVGSRTVVVDDPLLTARGAFRARPLVRVLVDWRRRIPASARVFSTLDAGPVIMIRSAGTADSESGDDPVAAEGVTVETFPTQALAPVLTRLAGKDVVSLLVEGGPALQTAFLAAGLVDRVQWVVTPHMLGTGIRQPATVEMLLRRSAMRERKLGSDTLYEADVHRAD